MFFGGIDPSTLDMDKARAQAEARRQAQEQAQQQARMDLLSRLQERGTTTWDTPFGSIDLSSMLETYGGIPQPGKDEPTVLDQIDGGTDPQPLAPEPVVPEVLQPWQRAFSGAPTQAQWGGMSQWQQQRVRDTQMLQEEAARRQAMETNPGIYTGIPV